LKARSQKSGDLKMSHTLEAGQFVVDDFSCVNPTSKTSVNKNKNSTGSLAAAKHIQLRRKRKRTSNSLKGSTHPRSRSSQIISQYSRRPKVQFCQIECLTSSVRWRTTQASIVRRSVPLLTLISRRNGSSGSHAVALIRSNAATVLDVDRREVRKRNIVDPSQRTAEELDVADLLL